MKKNSTLLIRINDDLKKEIQTIADNNDVSVSEIINIYLKDIAKEGDLSSDTKEKLGVLDRKRFPNGKLDIIAIKHALVNAITTLKLEQKINKVYLYGSFARGEETPNSDIDLRLETTDDISMFEIGNLRHQIKEQTGRDVDISNQDIDKLDPKFYSNIKKDEICIYER